MEAKKKELKSKKFRKNVMLEVDKDKDVKNLAKQRGEKESTIINEALGEYFSKRMSTKFIAFLNQKGGVGKSTSAQSVSVGLAKLNKRVLAIDVDPQGNFTKGLDAYEPGMPSVYEMLKGEYAPQDVIINREGIDIIPADLRLSQFEYLELPGKEFLLKNRFSDFDFTKYDYVVFDCAPSFGKLNLGVLAMVHSIYVPIQTEYYAMEGVTQLMQTIEMGRNLLMNKDLTLKGVFATMYDSRRNLDKAALDKVQEFFGDKLMDTKIRRNIKLSEAQATHKSIFAYDSTCNGAKDYMNLTKEVVAREEQSDNEQ